MIGKWHTGREKGHGRAWDYSAISSSGPSGNARNTQTAREKGQFLCHLRITENDFQLG